VSIYKRSSGRWAVLVDQDAQACRLVAQLAESKSNKRRTATLGRFTNRKDAERAMLRAIESGETRELFIEENARRRSTLGTYATKKDAEKAEREALMQRDRGVELSSRTVTVGALLKRFIDDRRRMNKAVRTVERYDDLARLYLLPSLGSILLAKLTGGHVSDLAETLQRSGGRDGGALAPKTVSHAIALLRSALRFGLENEFVGRVVVTKKHMPTARQQEAFALDEPACAKVIAAADAGRWGPFVRLALATGTRRGELCGLRWSDIDERAMKITIRCSIVETKDGASEKGTKTDRIRVIPMTALALGALKAQKAKQASEKLAAELYDDSGHVFQTEHGGFQRPMQVSDAFRTIADHAKVPVTPHVMRHTAASWMLSAGIDAKTVSVILGHSTPVTTLNIYAHLMPGDDRHAIEAIDERLTRAVNAGPEIPDGNRMATGAPIVVPIKREKPRIY